MGRSANRCTPHHEDLCLINTLHVLQKHFSKVRGPRTPEQKAARRAALVQNVPGNADVDEAMLDTATAMSMVSLSVKANLSRYITLLEHSHEET